MSLEKKLDYSNFQLYEIGDTEIENLVLNALRYNIETIVIGPSALDRVYQALKPEEKLNINVAVSYPSGAYTVNAKIQEIEGLFELNCKIDGLYIVMQVGAYLSGHIKEAEKELKDLVKAAKGVPIKLITEISVMTNEQIEKLCDIAAEAGVQALVTSAGFLPYDVKRAEVTQYKAVVSAAKHRFEIVANEQTSSREDAEKLLKLGIDRICTPYAIQILK